MSTPPADPPPPAAPPPAPAADDTSAHPADDDLHARLRDAALGELDPAELARLQADLAARPDRAADQARRDRLARLLAAAEAHPALATFQPRDAWRLQTLHKAKVEAARLRRQREARALPVARPPLTHRQLAGKTTQSISVDGADTDDFPRPAHPFAADPRHRAVADLSGPAGSAGPGIRKLFLTVALTAAAGILLLAFLGARLLHRWQSAGAPPPAAGPATHPPPTDPPAGSAAQQPLSPRELLLLKRDYPDLGQVLDATADSILFELGGPVPGKGWLAQSPPDAPQQLWRCLAPNRWDRIDLEGDLHAVTLHFVADSPHGLSLQIIPRPPAAAAPAPDSPADPPVPADPAGPRPPVGGWQLTLLKNGQAVESFDIPGPVGGDPVVLAIERVTLRPGEEQLRFQAVPRRTAAPFAPATALDRDWQVLSERLLPVPCAPGHWVLEWPASAAPAEPSAAAPDIPVAGLSYILRARLPRPALAPRTAD